MKDWIVSRMIPWFAFEKKMAMLFLYGLDFQGTKLFSINYTYTIGNQSYCSISCDWHAHTCICVSS